MSAFVKALLDDTDAATARTTLGVAIGADVQAYDAGLQSISGLTTAADRTIYTTASDVYATTALTPFARTILRRPPAPAAVKTTLGLAAVAVVRIGLGSQLGTIPTHGFRARWRARNSRPARKLRQCGCCREYRLSHIQLYSGYGFTITGSTLNYTVPTNSSHVWNVNGTEVGRLNTSGLTLATPLALAEGGTGSTDAATGEIQSRCEQRFQSHDRNRSNARISGSL